MPIRLFGKPAQPAAPAEPPVRKVKADEKVYVASQWQLMWWKFRRHRLAMASGLVVILLYLVAVFAEPIAIYDPKFKISAIPTFPRPSSISWMTQGSFHLVPFVYGINQKRNLETLALEYAEDTTVSYSLQFFVSGDPYKLWGLFPSKFHLFGAEGDGKLLLLRRRCPGARPLLAGDLRHAHLDVGRPDRRVDELLSSGC